MFLLEAEILTEINKVCRPGYIAEDGFTMKEGDSLPLRCALCRKRGRKD